METYSTFRIFWICGLAGVLVDLDHPYAILLNKTLYPSVVEGRLFHPLLFLIACFIILSLGTCIGRLYLELVLRRRKC
jgi:hypothetical protein